MPLDSTRDRDATIAIPAVSGASRTSDCGSRSGPRWYCVQTRPGHEERAALNLGFQGFTAWLPLRRIEVRKGRAVIERRVPLFPRYLFTQFDVQVDSWRPIAHTFGVCRLFGQTPEKPTPVLRSVMDALLAAAMEDAVVERPADVLLRAGARVRVVDGAFASFHGLVLASRPGSTVVEVEIFGRSTPVEFTNPAHLEAA